MFWNKKDYSKYYKKACSKHKHKSKVLKILKFFLLLVIVFFLFICSIFTFYVLVSLDMHSADDLANTEVINQVVSIKKKELRSNFSSWNKNCDWNLIVVNDLNSMPEYFLPNLKTFGDIEVDKRITSDLDEMIQDAAKENILLWISSAYRSKEHQEQLFNQQIEKFINEGYDKGLATEKAEKLVARPEKSEHCTGLAVDFNAATEDFLQTKEYAWLIEHSSRYGFIERYPKDKEEITKKPFEPGHFRYVGEEHANTMKTRNMCLEEYVSTLFK